MIEFNATRFDRPAGPIHRTMRTHLGAAAMPSAIEVPRSPPRHEPSSVNVAALPEHAPAQLEPPSAPPPSNPIGSAPAEASRTDQKSAAARFPDQRSSFVSSQSDGRGAAQPPMLETHPMKEPVVL